MFGGNAGWSVMTAGNFRISQIAPAQTDIFTTQTFDTNYAA